MKTELISFGGKSQQITRCVEQGWASFIKRHLQHITAYYNGEYQIYEGDAFSEGRKINVWEGALGPKNRQKLPVFVSQSADLGPKLQDFLARLNFFLIPVNGDRRVRERLESASSRLLYRDGGRSSNFQDEGIRYRPCWVNEEPITFEFDRELPIHGLPQSRILRLPLD